MSRQITLYQIYDDRAQITHGPILGNTRDAAAIRIFNEILSRKDTEPGRYPADFTLLKIGYQDENTGQLAVENPEVIATGTDWLEAQDRQRRIELVKNSLTVDLAAQNSNLG